MANNNFFIDLLLLHLIVYLEFLNPQACQHIVPLGQYEKLSPGEGEYLKEKFLSLFIFFKVYILSYA